jgi:hypothetical protein
MNFPINLLFDIELAKSRLQEAFKSAAGSTDYRKTQPAHRKMEKRAAKTSEDSVPPSFRLPEVRGCAGVSFQAL